MKSYLAIAVFCVIAILAFAQEDESQYTTKFDNVDVEEILKSDRLFNNYYNCLMEKGNCTPEGRELRKLLPDALKTKCAKCSEKQKTNAEKVINFIIENKKDEWKTLQEKYDPQGVYVTKYKEEAEKRGIKL